MSTTIMEAQIQQQDNKLPYQLEALMTKTMEDNNITSWRIYGGNYTTISIRFESNASRSRTESFKQNNKG